jgi:Na+-transporting methylmalonyl-CoA/oxaloacetate decarboxylase gamma subunit
MSSCIITGMSIQELSLKFKGLFQNTEIVLGLLIVVVSLASFFLGRFSVGEKIQEIQAKTEVPHTQNNESQVIQAVDIQGPPKVETSDKSEGSTAINEKSGYVASKSGTKYHLPWCGSAKKIKDENKIWFATKEEAEKAGYTPASNCKGI